MVRESRHRRWLVGGFALALTVLLVGFPEPADAGDATSFKVAYQDTLHGGFVTIGNILASCTPGVGECNSAMNDLGVGTGNISLSGINIDGDPSLRNSSYAELVLPPGAEVVWAGLYWGARTTPAINIPDTMSFKWEEDPFDNLNPYEAVTFDAFWGEGTSTINSYQRFADVTDYVKDKGSGFYWGANVMQSAGNKRYAGWSLTVVYEDPSAPLRNITIYDGFETVSSSSPNNVRFLQVHLPDIQVPITADVQARTTSMAWEGDGNTANTFATLRPCGDVDSYLTTTPYAPPYQNDPPVEWWTNLSTSLSPAQIYFNSTIDTDGASVMNRMPNHLNTFGLDIKNHDVTGIPPGIDPKNTCLVATSAGDLYFLGVFGLAIDILSPELKDSTKKVENLSGGDPAKIGDQLRYTVTVKNTGDDGIADVVITDVIPANATYVPDSMTLLRYYNSTGTPVTTPLPLSDEVDDDVGSFDAATKSVTINAGIGATADEGGIIPHKGEVSFSFDVIADDESAGTTITNQASFVYRGAPTFEEETFLIKEATIDVDPLPERSELTLTVTPITADTNDNGHPAFYAGGPFGYLLETTVAPDVSHAHDVTVTAYLPSGFKATSVSSSLGTCSIGGGGTVVTCHLGSLYSRDTVTNSTAVDILIQGTVGSTLVTYGEPRYMLQAIVTSSTLGRTGDDTLAVSAMVGVDVLTVISTTGGFVAGSRAITYLWFFLSFISMVALVPAGFSHLGQRFHWTCER
ncbi:MAG: DUF3344 domain-containing protein [Propionibacteriaceae bacterium]|nr:DUF3344 domain-containing protein [Propionibacteriaceae bacterium]